MIEVDEKELVEVIKVNLADLEVELFVSVHEECDVLPVESKIPVSNLLVVVRQ